MNPSPVRVTRDVPVDDKNNYLGRDVKEGETFYLFNQHTYGCISNDGSGVALSRMPGEYPFFEFPAYAIEDPSEVIRPHDFVFDGAGDPNSCTFTELNGLRCQDSPEAHHGI